MQLEFSRLLFCLTQQPLLNPEPTARRFAKPGRYFKYSQYRTSVSAFCLHVPRVGLWYNHEDKGRKLDKIEKSSIEILTTKIRR